MSASGIFDLAKLPGYTEGFANARVIVEGCGAVGSAVVEKLVKMGVRHIVTVDCDNLEAGNLSKSSCIYRYPDDIGKNKAKALAERGNELLGEECLHGINAGVASFGPMAYANFDVIILALDNYAAKICVNQNWLQLHQSLRPILIFGGTLGEAAQSNCIDGTDSCMRCLYSEEMLENPLAHSSCLGVQYRNDDPSLGIVVTSGLASGLSADFICEQTRAALLGDKSAVNKRIVYNAHPAFRLDEVSPMKRKGCPDCRAFHSKDNLNVMTDGNTLESSLGDLFGLLSGLIGNDDYEVSVAVIEYAKISYGKVIVDDFCKSCLKDMMGIYRHEFKVKYEDLLCDECRDAGKTANPDNLSEKKAFGVSAFSPKTSSRELQSKKLIELGFRIGEIYQVIIRGNGIDFLDASAEYRYFYFEQDTKLMHRIDKLEG